MVSKSWVACAALLTLLSGCINDAPGTDPAPEPVQGIDGGNETVDQAVNNTAPVALLEASAINGTAPLNVTLTLNGTDAEGTNLTWTLTVGNQTLNGTSLPATVNQTLGAGNHTITLTVSDGNLTGNATMLIQVAEAAEELVEEADDGICHADASDYQALPPAGPTILYLADTSWIYEESNGIAGLQWSSEASLGGEHHALGEGCLQGDTLLF